MTPERNSSDLTIAGGSLVPAPEALGRILAALLRIEDLLTAQAALVVAPIVAPEPGATKRKAS